MRATAHSFIVIGVLSQLAVAARGQTRSNSGFWAAISVGYGSAEISCDNCVNNSRIAGLSVLLNAGKIVSRSVRLGASVDGWTHWSNGSAETMTGFMVSLDYFPLPSGLFLAGGLGVSRYGASGSPGVAGIGWGGSIAVGYEQPVSRRISLRPMVGLEYGLVGDVTVTDGGALFASGWKQQVVQLSLGGVFH